jgi:hypothetical protein
MTTRSWKRGGRGPRALWDMCAVELAVFCVGTRRHFSWVHPRWFDQVQCVTESHDSHAQGQAHGFLAGARAALGHEPAQCAVHAFLARLRFEVAAPSLNKIAIPVL